MKLFGINYGYYNICRDIENKDEIAIAIKLCKKYKIIKKDSFNQVIVKRDKLKEELKLAALPIRSADYKFDLEMIDVEIFNAMEESGFLLYFKSIDNSHISILKAIQELNTILTKYFNIPFDAAETKCMPGIRGAHDVSDNNIYINNFFAHTCLTPKYYLLEVYLHEFIHRIQSYMLISSFDNLSDFNLSIMKSMMVKEQLIPAGPKAQFEKICVNKSAQVALAVANEIDINIKFYNIYKKLVIKNLLKGNDKQLVYNRKN